MATEQPIFFYDLGSPACYLAAERLVSLPVVSVWQPVRAADVGVPAFEAERELVESLAPRRDLQPLRWPSQLTAETDELMLAATYAAQIGRVVAFSLACFRQIFAAGRDPADPNTVLIAAAACEMHPAAVLKGIGLRSVSGALRAAGERAVDAGISALPALRLGDALAQGVEAIDAAALELEPAT